MRSRLLDAVAERPLEFVRASFRRKLAAALLVVLLISAAAAAGLYLQIGALLDDSVEQSMTASADAEASELTEWSRHNRLVTRVLSEHPVYEDRNTTAARAYLQQQLAERRESRIVNAYVIDRRNLTVETSAVPALEGTAVEDLPWQSRFAFRSFDDVRTTRPHEALDGETVVVGFVTPIRQSPGHLLVVTFEAASVFERFEHPVEGGFTRVVDSNGTVVFADNRSAMLQQYQPGALRAPVVTRGIRGESGFVRDLRYEQSAPESDYVAAFAPVRGTDWVLIEHAPTSEAYAITHQVGFWIGIIVAIALLGLLAVVTVLGADVTGALTALAERADRIESGEYDVAFDTDRPDEFGDLNRTLARTRDTLRRRIEEIEAANEALEASNVALENRSAMVTVLNRVLRHNVRNDVNSIAGWARLLAERTEDEQLREELEIIRETAAGLASITSRTQRIDQLLSDAPTERTTLRFPDCLESPLEAVRSSWPDATITLTVADEPGPVADGTASFPVAVADVVDRIVASNGGAVLVDVTVAQEPAGDGDGAERVVLTIQDDGSGLPELDIQAIEAGEETPLEHAEGLSLWCLEWATNRTEGELVVDATDATVEVRLPPAVEGPGEADAELSDAND